MSLSTASKRTDLAVGKFGQKMLSGVKKKSLMQLAGQMASYWGRDLGGRLAGVNIRPDFMLGWVPFWGSTRIEVGKSDRQLRWRSVGGQFLAFQEGDSLGVKITLTLQGTTRYVWLSYLDWLYVNGMPESTSRELTNADPNNSAFDAGEAFNVLNESGNYIPFLTGNKEMIPQNGVTGSFGSELVTIEKTTKWKPETIAGTRGNIDDLEPSNAGAFDSTTPIEEIPEWQKRERMMVRKTFNLVTEPEVFVDMYIENYFYNRDVRTTGKNELEVDLLLRRYVEPPERIYIETNEKVPHKKKKTVTTTNMENVRAGSNGKLQRLEDEVESVRVVKFKTKGTVEYSEDQWNALRPQTQGSYKKKITDIKTKKTGNKIYNDIKPGTKSGKEFEASLNRKDTEDEYYYTNKQHKYVGTRPRQSQEKAMLAVNILWRIGWMTTDLISAGNHAASTLSSDPIIGRLALIKNRNNELTNQVSTVEGNTESVVEGDLRKHSDGTGKKDNDKEILAIFGNTDDSDLDDMFVIPERQDIFEEMLYKGFTHYTLSGKMSIDGELQFYTPVDISFSCLTHTDPYTRVFTYYVDVSGATTQVEEGSLIYLGNGDTPTWTIDTYGDYWVNKNVLEEMYLYVEKIQHNGEYISFLAHVVHPARGI